MNALAMAITMGAISIGWSLWQKYASHISFLTALESPAGTAPETVQAKIDAGLGAKLAVLFVAGAVACSALIGVSACASKTAPTVSPTTANAQRALQVVKALDVIRDTAASLNASNPPILSSADLQIVVRIHEAAIKVIDAVPSGWKPTVLASLDELQKDLPAASYQRIATYVDAARLAIAAFAPGDLTPHLIPPAQIAADVAEDDGYRALDALPEVR